MKPSDLVKQIEKLVKTRFQGFIPGMSEEDLQTYTWLVAEMMIDISNDPNNPGLGKEEVVEMAMDYVEKHFDV